MCGIAGFVGAKNYYPSKSNIKSCIKLMKLRGPDFQDIKKFNTNNLEYLFCASRLSIIDIDNRSNQPLQDDDGILIFNGEIYNYLELKKKMQKKKINFKTKSDTEVLLKFLNYFGLERINEIHGMWSFAYYSKIKKKFYLCRDRFGEKPIFYSLNKDKKEFYFG
jgi:asparagine synthase (glutamine-hydrolysing)